MQHGVGIERLAFSSQFIGDVAERTGGEVQAVDRTAEVGDFRIVLCEYDRRIHALCLRLKHRACLVGVFSDDNGRIRLYYARFLAGYCSKRVAEKLSVVKRDVGDDAQHR